MPSRAQQKRSVLVGPISPVPVSTVFEIYDYVTFTKPDLKLWVWTAPNDGMVYKLCDFTHISLPAGFMYALIRLNGIDVWNEYGAYQNQWRPTYANAMSLVFPDELQIWIVQPQDFVSTHYWQMSFWKEQQHEV